MNKIILIFIMIIAIPCNVFAWDLPSNADIYWLTQNIYHEARGEDLSGQIMVGMVTLERLNSGKWGNSIKSVVTFPAQFSWYSDGKSDIPKNKNVWKTTKNVAIVCIMIYNKVKNHGIMYYHNNKVHPSWAKKMTKIMTIGNHTFYKG